MIKPEQLAGNTEASQQQALFAWAGLARPEYPQLKWLHAIPNANSHRQVAEGVRAGIADIFLPWPVHGERIRHGLYIEMKLPKRLKEKNGGLLPDQMLFGEYAKSIGYEWFVCYGWADARDKIMEYLR